MVFSILARCPGGIFASASAGTGMPVVKVVVVISHAPVFAFKESANAYKGVATAKATAHRRRFLANIFGSLKRLIEERDPASSLAPWEPACLSVHDEKPRLSTHDGLA
jgi:hypothetical protein